LEIRHRAPILQKQEKGGGKDGDRRIKNGEGRTEKGGRKDGMRRSVYYDQQDSLLWLYQLILMSWDWVKP